MGLSRKSSRGGRFLAIVKRRARTKNIEFAIEVMRVLVERLRRADRLVESGARF